MMPSPSVVHSNSRPGQQPQLPIAGAAAVSKSTGQHIPLTSEESKLSASLRAAVVSGTASGATPDAIDFHLSRLIDAVDYSTGLPPLAAMPKDGKGDANDPAHKDYAPVRNIMTVTQGKSFGLVAYGNSGTITDEEICRLIKGRDYLTIIDGTGPEAACIVFKNDAEDKNKPGALMISRDGGAFEVWEGDASPVLPGLDARGNFKPLGAALTGLNPASRIVMHAQTHIETIFREPAEKSAMLHPPFYHERQAHEANGDPFGRRNTCALHAINQAWGSPVLDHRTWDKAIMAPRRELEPELADTFRRNQTENFQADLHAGAPAREVLDALNALINDGTSRIAGTVNGYGEDIQDGDALTLERVKDLQENPGISRMIMGTGTHFVTFRRTPAPNNEWRLLDSLVEARLGENAADAHSPALDELQPVKTPAQFISEYLSANLATPLKNFSVITVELQPPKELDFAAMNPVSPQVLDAIRDPSPTVTVTISRGENESSPIPERNAEEPRPPAVADVPPLLSMDGGHRVLPGQRLDLPAVDRSAPSASESELVVEEEVFSQFSAPLLEVENLQPNAENPRPAVAGMRAKSTVPPNVAKKVVGQPFTLANPATARKAQETTLKPAQITQEKIRFPALRSRSPEPDSQAKVAESILREFNLSPDSPDSIAMKRFIRECAAAVRSEKSVSGERRFQSIEDLEHDENIASNYLIYNPGDAENPFVRFVRNAGDNATPLRDPVSKTCPSNYAQEHSGSDLRMFATYPPDSNLKEEIPEPAFDEVVLQATKIAMMNQFASLDISDRRKALIEDFMEKCVSEGYYHEMVNDEFVYEFDYDMEDPDPSLKALDIAAATARGVLIYYPKTNEFEPFFIGKRSVATDPSNQIAKKDAMNTDLRILLIK